MTPTTEHGLATHSDKHGCSTGGTEGWKLVTSKGKKPKAEKVEVPKSGISYLKALLKIGKSEESVVPDQDMGSPPNNKKKINRGTFRNNRFDALSDTEEVEDQDEVFHDAVSEDLPPPAKRTKHTHVYSWSDDFYEALEEYKNLPPPDYAYSAHEAAHTKINKKNKQDDSSSTPQEYQKVEEVQRTMVPITAVDYMEFSEDILKKEDDYERLRYETNETIKEASDQAISFLYPDGYDGLVSLLPKLYTTNYPVSTYVLPQLNIKKLIESSPFYIRQ